MREELERAGQRWAASAPPRRVRALRGLVDTFVPAIAPPTGHPDQPFWALRASDADIDVLAAGYLATRVEAADRAGLEQLLDLMGAAGLGALPGPAGEVLVKSLRAAGGDLRRGVEALRQLTVMLHYASPQADGRNPTWALTGYPGPPELEATARRHLDPTPIDPEVDRLELSADAVVVGSGAGGGVIAAELAAAGLDVVVLEAGGDHQEADFRPHEAAAFDQLYWRGGYQATSDDQVTIVAGGTLGGGTTVNWAACVPPPPWVRRQWAVAHGLVDVDTPAFDEHIEVVAKRLGVTEDCNDASGPNARLAEGCETLGWAWRRTARNIDRGCYDPASAGHIGFGDRSGAKQGTLQTFLAAAAADGARILVRTTAQRILLDGGRAAGVAALHTTSDGRDVPVTITAPTVVSACGALETPALLLRSGIGGPAVGRYLRLHPVVALVGFYDEPQNPWWGAPLTVVGTEFADRADGYGFLLECPHFGAGLSAASLPWLSGRDHKRLMGRSGHAASFIGLVRDRGSGTVTLDEAGEAVVRYPLTDPLDRKHHREALGAMARAHVAGGARAVVDLHPRRVAWTRGTSIDTFIARIQRLPSGAGGRPVFSAHQMGSARMGTDPRTSVADPAGLLHDTPGVWIGDTSAFPTPSGSNPMLTCMALAHRTARHLLADR